MADFLEALFIAHLDAWLDSPLAELRLRLAHPAPELLQAVADEQPRVVSLAPSLAQHVQRRLQKKNQFAAITERPLYNVLEGWLKALADAPAEQRKDILSELPQRLSPMLKDLGARETVSHEYSPQLQLQVLQLDEKQLLAPVLDVGCGVAATLVMHLRSLGLDATGIDRDVKSDVALKADWLSYAYGEKKWGTVVSHLGFSLHFLNRHLSGSADAEKYARVYMAILRSLKPGGTFAYTPALPFIEEHLPPQLFKAEVAMLPKELRSEALEKQVQATGVDLAASTRVRRVA
ncbi:MAG: class I SAM-dependent methyltransferase [Myxococcaceae bacterium]